MSTCRSLHSTSISNFKFNLRSGSLCNSASTLSIPRIHAQSAWNICKQITHIVVVAVSRSLIVIRSDRYDHLGYSAYLYTVTFTYFIKTTNHCIHLIKEDDSVWDKCAVFRFHGYVKLEMMALPRFYYTTRSLLRWTEPQITALADLYSMLPSTNISAPIPINKTLFF